MEPVSHVSSSDLLSELKDLQLTRCRRRNTTLFGMAVVISSYVTFRNRVAAEEERKREGSFYVTTARSGTFLLLASGRVSCVDVLRFSGGGV